MYMRKSLFLSSVVLASTLLSATAFAGEKAVANVVIGSGYISGSIGSARNSVDAVQYVVCGVTAASGSTTASCVAKTTAGAQAYCSTTSPTLISALSSVTANSHFYITYSGTT